MHSLLLVVVVAIVIVVVVVPFVVALLYCLLYPGLFFIASFTPIADVSVQNAPQSENFNYYFQLSKMVLRLFQFTFYTRYPCCFAFLFSFLFRYVSSVF